MIFLESPWPVLFIGLAIEAALAIALWRTGRGVLLAWMGGVALLVLLGVVIERLVVTERERVAETVYGIAAALEANDVQRALAFISKAPEAAESRDAVNKALTKAHIVEIRMRNLDVKVNQLTSPPTAMANFNVLVTGSFHNSDIGERSVLGTIALDLRLELGRWMIMGHKVSTGIDPRQ